MQQFNRKSNLKWEMISKVVMVKYAHTTIDEDLLLIEKTYASISDNKEELPIVNVIEKKFGLDDMNGKYVIDGAVVLGTVSSRGKNSRSGDACGYKVSRLLIDDEGKVALDSRNKYTVVESKIVTKEQGIHLTQFMGAKNAYIRIQERKDKEGTVIKNIVYLRPFPAKTQAFFLDGRVVKVYETNEYGERIKPIQLRLKKEECTSKMWTIIQNDYALKFRREKPKKNMVESRKENDRKMNTLRETLIQSNMAMVNPFK